MDITETEVREWATQRQYWILFASSTMHTDPRREAHKHFYCSPAPMMLYEVVLGKETREFGSLIQALESYNRERWIPDGVKR